MHPVGETRGGMSISGYIYYYFSIFIKYLLDVNDCKSSITISKSNLFCIHFFTLWQMQTCSIFNRNLIYLLVPLCTAFMSLVVSKNRLVSQGQRKIYHPLRKIKWSLSKRIQLYSPLFPFEWEKVSKSYPTRLW